MKRDLALDSLKVLLAAFVVGIHSYFLNGSGSMAGDILGNGLFRMAVPVFFMINGFFFTRVLEKGSLLPWMKKVLVLYGVWMVIYLPFYFPDGLSISASARFLKTLLVGYHHIWYLSALFFAGMLIYFLRTRSTRFLLVSSIGLFLSGVVLQYMRAYVHLPQVSINGLLDIEWISRNFLFIGYPFMVAGIIMRRHSIKDKLSVVQLWTLFAVASCLVLIEAGVNYAFLNTTRHSFDCLLTLGFACPLLFIAVSKLNWTHQSRRLSDLSMVIYFVHPLFISLLVDWWGLSNNGFNITGYVLVLSVLMVPFHDGVKNLISRTFQPMVLAR